MARSFALCAAALLWACGGDGTSRPPEADCFNGLDDNGDGLEDCRDPSCRPEAECVAAAPGFALGTTTGPSEACPGAFAEVDLLLGQGLAPGSTCGACACSPPEVYCFSQVMVFEDQVCASGPSRFAPVFSGTSCTVSGGFLPPIRSVYVPALAIATGACAPNNPVPEVTWSERRRFCGTALAGGGCAAGQACVPRAAAHCALAAGARACPTGYQPVNQASWYGGVDDQRVCPCACGPPTDQPCASLVVELLGPSCSGAPALLPQGACVVRDFGTELQLRATGSLGGSCAPSATGGLTGAALPTGEETLCCAP